MYPRTNLLCAGGTLIVEYLVAGGGGGGGASPGADGASGGTLATGFAPAPVGTSWAVTVGTRGGGSSNFAVSGAAGTSSSIATIATCAGGAGGLSQGTGGSNRGGDGAGGAHSGSTGGPGVTSSISGSSVTYCEGGDSNTAATKTGPGSGGEGNDQPSGAGRDGQDGIVIIRYPGAQKATGGTITSAGGYTLHTFTANGTFAVT